MLRRRLRAALTTFITVLVALASAGTLPATGRMYVLDLNTGNYDRVSVDNAGAQADGLSVAPVISADGRYVAYLSGTTNLVPNDTNDGSDYFLRDRQLGTTEPLTVVHAGSLNDTGQTQCYDGNGAKTSCTVAPAADDGRYGRDAAAAAGALTKIGAGVAGFDFTKIANNGSILPAGAALGTRATDWACTRDNVTGLTWEVKTTGPTDLRFSGHSYTWYNTNGAENGGDAGSAGLPNTNVGTCNGTLPSNLCNTQAFVAAVNTTALCGYTDWRLPTPPELRTIVNYGAGISLDTTYFPNTVGPAYWSASTYVAAPAGAHVVIAVSPQDPQDVVSCVGASCAWVVESVGVDDGGGAGHAHFKAGPEDTRLVRGAPAPSGRACTAGHPNANVVESTPSADFTDNGNGTVTHAKTGLMWKQCAEGLSGATCATGAATETTWSNALAAAENSSFAGFTDWRLPNLKELHSIVETCGNNPAINQNMFPAMPAPAFGSVFWSASSYASSPGNAWVFVFGGGGGVGTSKASLVFSRLVRGGQSFDAFDSQPTVGGSPTGVTVTAIVPASGSTAGGSAVTIAGANFVSGAIVTIGGVAATNVTVENGTAITATTAAHAAGLVSVVVTNPDTQTGTLVNGFTYTSVSTMSLDKTSLVFSAVSSGAAFSAQTSTQTIRLTQTGAGPVTWTATSNKPWLTVTPASGSGSTALSIAVKFDSSVAAAGNATGTIALALTGAANTAGPVNVTFTIVSSAAPVSPPFGVVDTPAGDATVLAGSIAMTGWTLDNIGVQRVELWRDLQPGETTPPFASTPSDPRNGKVFIANATFVDGARPDVETLNPTMPFAYRAGWGYLLLTWGLWNQGNGTYKLYAFAFDQEDNLGTIGTKTVIISNNTATKPFGSIDTPGIGGDASGPNFGWGITPKVNGVATCKIQPSGVQVSIDSGPLQPVVYGDARTDIAGAFPGFSNTAAAGGHFIIDWSTLAPGAHTIGWLITDDCNRADGVGSRFFNVTGGTNLLADVPPNARAIGARTMVSAETESADPITVARGYGELPEIVTPGEAGSRTVEVTQGDRIEIRLPHGFESVYQLVNGGQRRALPTGATWDAASRTFYWQPAPAFLGRYRIVFTNGSARISVRVVVTP
jgi:hypothetical protein